MSVIHTLTSDANVSANQTVEDRFWLSFTETKQSIDIVVTLNLEQLKKLNEDINNLILCQPNQTS